MVNGASQPAISPLVTAGDSPEGTACPWQPEALAGVVDEIIEAAEEGRVSGYIARCAEAGLGPKLASEIEKDARFPKVAKALLKRAIPRLIAKWLNKAGLSAEWEDEISVMTALILIVKHNWQVSTKFDKLIEERNPKPAEPEKKEAA